MLDAQSRTVKQNSSEKVSIAVPTVTLNSLKREFSLTDSEVESFIISMIEKSIMDHAAASETVVFSETETKELEDDLRGLGYI